MTEQKITAYDVKTALASYCWRDFFMTEVKDGPTQIDQHELRILDGMSIAKSWVHPCVRGYEVKVSRGDYLRDGKWHTYFPLVNEFYLVCPEKMIAMNEIPVDCGLLWYRPKSKTLVMKQKATYTDGHPTWDMLMYIIMQNLASDRIPFFSSRAEEARTYIEYRKHNHDLGSMFKTALTKRVTELENQLQGNEDLESDAKRIRNVLDEIDKVLRKHDVGYGGWSTWRDQERAEYLDRRLSESYPGELNEVYQDLIRAENAVKKLMRRGEPVEEKGEEE